MRFEQVGFIGCGSMGGALANCIAKNVTAKGGRLYIADADKQKAAALASATFGAASTYEEIAERCGLIFISVKPQALTGVAAKLKARRDRYVLVSTAADITAESLTEALGVKCPVIRLMPNTPAAVGEGMILLSRSNVTDAELVDFAELMQAAGKLDELDEGLLDAASAISVCGPAFLCLAVEGLADGAVAMGLPRDKALKYAAQTLAGTGKLLFESGMHPGALKDSVASPGGATIQGVRAMEASAVRSAFAEAVIAACEKAAEQN